MKVLSLFALVAATQAVQLKKGVYPDPATEEKNAYLKSVIQGLQWCPDSSDKQTLQDGHTVAIEYPNNGFNCKNFHEVLGPNKSPYSQDGGPGW